MKQYQLIISADGASDLMFAKNWYGSQKEGLDLDFIQEIGKSIQRIKNNPYQFAIVRKKIRMSVVKRFPYLFLCCGRCYQRIRRFPF